MAPEPKLSERECARLRRLAADGWAAGDLAEAFGVSTQHVGRIVRGEQRATLAADGDDDQAVGDVLAAVNVFLHERLGDGDEVVAATARALAGKLDQACASTAAASASASPRIAAQLIATLAELRDVRREPDGLDMLRQRRALRLEGVRG
jgi:hypothetical protein